MSRLVLSKCDSLKSENRYQKQALLLAISRAGWMIAGLLVSLPLSASEEVGSQAAKAVSEVDPIYEKVDASAKRIRVNLDRISRMVYPDDPDSFKRETTKWSGVLAKPITLRWNGNLESVLEVIVSRIGYGEIEIKGRKPAAPITVVVDARNSPVGEVIENIGWQVGHNVGIVVDQGASKIQIVYLGDR